MTHFTNYSELSAYMDRLGLFHMDLTLDRMRAVWEERGIPDVPVVHVVGTNGKGSTSAFLCSLARAHSVKVGLFTSPHFVTPRERVQINRAMLPHEKWVELANKLLAIPGADSLTYFEFQTSLAMLAFERSNVQLAIMEAGLGGAYDATNVFSPFLTLFTPIGMDHVEILGPTLVDIARDKAGAIHRGGTIITGPQEGEVMNELQARARDVGARLMFSVDIAEPVREPLGLDGIHQSTNAQLGLAGWRWYAAGQELRSLPEAERFGLKSAFLPGRMQTVELNGQTVILDGAHNGHAFEALTAALRSKGIRPSAVVFACLGDKDAGPMIPQLLALTDGPIIIPQMQNDRAGDPDGLAAKIGDRARTADSMQAALASCESMEGPILVCGSLYLLAEFYSLYPEFLTSQR